MTVLYSNLTTVANHDIGRVKLTDLVHKEILHNEFYKETLKHLDVLGTCLVETLREVLF